MRASATKKLGSDDRVQNFRNYWHGAFNGGLVAIILAVQEDKSVWWWMGGSALLLTGLEMIIDAKIDKAKRKFFSGTDDSYYP